MKKVNTVLLKNIVIVLLIGIAAFSAYEYVIALKEKSDLMSQLAEKRIMINVLENEKQKLLTSLEKEKSQGQKLTKEKGELIVNLKASRHRLAKLFSGFSQNPVTRPVASISTTPQADGFGDRNRAIEAI